MGCAVGQAIGQYGNRVMIRVRDPWDRSSSHYPLGMGTWHPGPKTRYLVLDIRPPAMEE
jgi:hypothetical protein